MGINSSIKGLYVIIFFTTFLNAQTITIGTIDGEPEEKFSKFEALANYIQKKLKNNNKKINVEIPKNIPTAIKLINNKKLDIFIDSLYPTLTILKKTDLEIELKRWKNNSAGYNSIIFTKAKSEINSLNDLKGKTIAFEDPFSTSAYFVPIKAIEKAGLKISPIIKDKDKDTVKYFFSKNEMNSAAWVIFGKVDAGATDNITFDKFDQKLYKVIYKSKFIARHLVSFSKRINPEIKKEILNILLNMDKDEEGKEVLRSFSKTKKFSTIKDEELELWESFK